jgi:hypothetical protein
MRAKALRVSVVLIALILAAPAGLAAGAASTPAAVPGIEQATARLTMLDKDLDGLRGRIETARTVAPAPPPGMSEELGRARPRVREAVSLVFGLHWRQVEPVLAAAHAIERRIADLEQQVRTWPTEASRTAASVASSSAAGAITGIVTDEVTGSPLVNVTVYVSGPTYQAATTDATGRWIVTGLGTGTYYAYTSVVPVGYVRELFNDIPCVDSCYSYSGTAIAVSDGAVTSGVNFALARTGSVSGSVTDGTTGLGIAQVQVRLYTGSGWGAYQTADTGSDGSYSFPQVPPGTYYLTTYDNRYLDQLYDGMPCEASCTVSTGTPVVVVSSASTPDIDFTLQMGGSVSGKVTSAATGEPISGGYILLYGSSGQPAYAYLGSTGSYRFGQLQAGTYYAKSDVGAPYADQLYDGILCEPTCTVTTGTPIVVALGQETPNIDFALPTFGAFQGRVTDSVTGFPLVNTSVATYASDGTMSGYDYVDEYGDYMSGGLLTGTYFAVASSTTHFDELYQNLLCQPSCDPTAGTPIAVTLGSTTGAIDFALDLGGGFTGKVTAAFSGGPLGGVRVEVFDGSGVSAGYANTNEQGSFMLGDLPAGVYFARTLRSSTYFGQLYDGLPCEGSCTVTGGTPIPVTSGVLTPGVDFSLASLGSISGIVSVAGTGQRLSYAYVYLYDSTSTYVGYGVTDSEGGFRKTGLQAGTYFARATAGGYVPQLYNGILCPDPCTITDGTGIPVALSAQVGGIDFSMVPLGSISGTITDAATGLLLPYRDVAVYNESGTFVTFGYSDGTGIYKVSDLRAGRYFVSTTDNPDYVEELYDNLDCGAPCDVTKGTPVDLALGAVRTGIDFKLHKPYFSDVGLGHWARRQIEGIYVGGVTAGCGTNPLQFCPDAITSRWQMAVFLARSMTGSDAAVPTSGTIPLVGSYDCVAGGVSLFPNDVPPADDGCRHIHYIYGKGITAGCAPGSFCPGADTTRWQTAVFMAIALAGSDAAVPVSGTVPTVGAYNCVPGGTTLFPNDVPVTDGACRHVHYIYGEGLTAGCAPGSYCPSETLTRAQMAVFLATGFNFTKYGP